MGTLFCTRVDGGDGGASRDRTGDLYNAIVALSQLSYGPSFDGRQSRGGVGDGSTAKGIAVAEWVHPNSHPPHSWTGAPPRGDGAGSTGPPRTRSIWRFASSISPT